MNDYSKNSKKELVKIIEDQEQIILELQVKIKSSSKDGRNRKVLELLQKHESLSILDISKELGISTKNVSSQLTYLRTDGYQIFTNPQGRKVLMTETKDKVEEVEEVEEVEKVEEVEEVEVETEI